jgi:hypothetical protein
MPRDGSNIYHRPAGTDGVPNFPIESSKYNAYVADVEQDLNLPRPIVAGGTGATSADGALTNLSAEKAAQIVTNWDSMVWMAGSYYAATTASGIAPVAGHAFAGIAYVSNATVPITDMVLEATDVTDSANPDKYIRTMAAGVWGPWTRLNPNVSSANLGEYTFNNQVTFPPTAGQIRFNNATENSTTEVFISHLTATGFDNTTQITSYLTSGVDFAVQDKDEGNKYKVFTTTAAAVLSGGDFRVTVVLKIAGLDVVTAQRMLVTASSEAQRVQQRQLIYAAPFDALAYSGMQVNGSMEVSQELGTTGRSTQGYVCDGWTMNNSSGTVVISTATSVTTFIPGVRNILTLAVATPLVSLVSTDSISANQVIEGYRISRLAWGTASAQSITIGFWSWHTPAGLYSGSIRNAGGARSYVFTYTQATTSPQYNTVTIPGDTAGTWLGDNGVGVILAFSMACGTTFTAPSANTWLSGNYSAAPGQVNAVASTSNFFRITGVVVLPGIEAPSAARSPLIMRPYDQELITCQRYWTKGQVMWNGWITSGQSNVSEFVGYLPMRADPTVALFLNGGTGINGAGGGTSLSNGRNGFQLYYPTAVAGNASFNTNWTADARL